MAWTKEHKNKVTYVPSVQIPAPQKFFECPECMLKYIDPKDADECCKEWEDTAEAQCDGCGCSSTACCDCGDCSGCGCNCETCGCYGVSPTDAMAASKFAVVQQGWIDSTTAAVATKYGLNVDRNIAKEIADYYLTSHLWHRRRCGRAWVKLRHQVQELVPELMRYLDLACGGELRHGKVYPDNPYIQPCPVVDNYSGGRVGMWEAWAEWETPIHRAEYAALNFRMASYAGGYGGELWANIADTLALKLKEEVTDELWIDRVWNLQHNGGCALNKAYKVDHAVQQCLEAHGRDDHKLLLLYASADIRQLWQEVEDV